MGIQTAVRLRDVATWMPSAASPSTGHVDQGLIVLDRLAEQAGVTLYPQTDLATFVAVMRANLDRRGYLNPIFDPPGDETFWIAGLDSRGGLVTTQAARLYHWQRTNLLIEAEALRLHFPNGRGCRGAPDDIVEMGCTRAEMITGDVAFTGGIWIRPDFRGPRPELGGMRLTRFLARISRYAGYRLWHPDFSISSVSNALYEKGVAEEYGHPHAEAGIKIAMQFLGEGGAVLLWSSRSDIERDIDETNRVAQAEAT